MSQLIYNDLKGIINEVVGAGQPTGILTGVVRRLNPVEIVPDKHSDPIPSSLITVPQHLDPAYIDNYRCPAYPERVCGFNPINVGDTVFMIRGNSGQRFVVIGKV